MSALAATAQAASINWVPMAALIISLLMMVGGGVGFIVRRSDRNRDRTQEFVEDQVETVSTALSGRLDRIDQHLADQDRTIFQQNERLARVEGRLSIAPDKS